MISLFLCFFLGPEAEDFEMVDVVMLVGGSSDGAFRFGVEL